MDFQEMQKQKLSQVEQINELLQLIDKRANVDVLTLENVHLKQVLEKFAADLKEFRELLTNTMLENEQANLRTMNDWNGRLQEKLDDLLGSNELLEAVIAEKISTFAAEVDTLVKRHETSLRGLRETLAAASREYVGKVAADVEEAHTANKRYWAGWKGRNAAIMVYVIIGPALTVLDILARHFGWF